MFHDGQFLKLISVVLFSCVLLPACVERKLTIKSNPSGARAYLDYDRKGRTPVQVDFTHYGSRFVRLEKSGYRTKLATFDLDPPWHSYFPINLFTEVLYPFTIRDHRVQSFQLEAEPLPADREPDEREHSDRDEIQERAEELRQQSPGSPTSGNQ